MPIFGRGCSTLHPSSNSDESCQEVASGLSNLAHLACSSTVPVRSEDSVVAA